MTEFFNYPFKNHVIEIQCIFKQLIKLFKSEEMDFTSSDLRRCTKSLNFTMSLAVQCVFCYDESTSGVSGFSVSDRTLKLFRRGLWYPNLEFAYDIENNHFSTWNKSLGTDPARHTSTSKCHCSHFVTSSSSSSPLGPSSSSSLNGRQRQIERLVTESPKGHLFCWWQVHHHYSVISCLGGIRIQVYSTDYIMDSLIKPSLLDGRMWKP